MRAVCHPAVCSVNPANITILSRGSGTTALTMQTTTNSALEQPSQLNLWGLGGGGGILAVPICEFAIVLFASISGDSVNSFSCGHSCILSLDRMQRENPPTS